MCAEKSAQGPKWFETQWKNLSFWLKKANFNRRKIPKDDL